MSKPNYFFGFDRHRPEPFDSCDKRVTGVTSVHTPSSVTYSTLSSPMLKAFLAYCKMEYEPECGGIGVSDKGVVVEYKSSNENQYHLVCFNAGSGKVQAIVYDVALGSGQSYKGGKDGRDCAAIYLAMIPAFLKDPEFRENMEAFEKEYATDFANFDEAVRIAAVLCDNIYRRIQNDDVVLDSTTCVAPTKISMGAIDSGQYIPKEIIAGEFNIFAHGITGMTPGGMKKSVGIPHDDFEGKYRFVGRTLTKEEEAAVPVLPDWYVVPQEAKNLCLHVKKTTDKKKPMRNFLLRGPAGTGKTEMAKAVAAGVHLPYVKYTCSANTEVYDFIGQMMPVNADPSVDIPSYDDIGFDPVGSYQQLTGIEKEDATPDDCLEIIKKLVAGSETRYEYTETDFLKALKYGWVCEVQEPTVIMQPGVLVGLNSLLEQDGMITLPNGEVIRRHPDCIIIVTTNMSYEGCRGLNQSVVDRMNLVKDILLPDKSIMLERAMNVTEFDDPAMAEQMVEVVLSMIEYCKHQGIDDGEVGIRSLIDWMLSTEVTNDPYDSALDTVIAKATAEDTDRSSLIENCLEPVFTRKRAK